jgi:endonuclease-3
VKAPGYGRVLGRLAALYDIDRFRRANGESPFRILVGCVISLRTKDEVTYPATGRLFALARDPAGMGRLSEATIAKAIYPAGFYRTKARQIRALSRILVDRYDGRVPATIEELVELPGVGRKTANLTVTLGFGRPGICVDTHVHRIAGRLGWAATRSPDETERALRASLPRRWWIPINETLVRHGQAVCHPVSPRCSVCAVARVCPQVGVVRSR